MRQKTMKLSERHRYKLAVIANLEGVAEQTVVESMIDSRGAETRLGPHSWDLLWDDEESVRWLRAYAMSHYKARQVGGGEGSEGDLLRFINAHPLFFYVDPERKGVRRSHEIVLWPHRWELTRTWMAKRETDYNIGKKEMSKILERAKLPVPANG